MFDQRHDSAAKGEGHQRHERQRSAAAEAQCVRVSRYAHLTERSALRPTTHNDFVGLGPAMKLDNLATATKGPTPPSSDRSSLGGNEGGHVWPRLSIASEGTVPLATVITMFLRPKFGP